MITKEKFDILSDPRFETASWAIWSNEFNKSGCIEGQDGQPRKYFIKNLSNLKNNVVFTALNRSGNEDIVNQEFIHSMKNFHSIGHRGDGLLKDTLEGLTNLLGGYMTDISDEIEGNSSIVTINENKTWKQFIEQLTLLGSDKVYIICFGNDVFNAFKNILYIRKHEENKYGVKIFKTNWKGISLNFYRILHYSYFVNGRGNHRINEFKPQLAFVNSEINNE